MNGDIIKLEIPAKPDYIVAVRLTVSAVAQRAGFDIEDIEDLKVAAAEACMLFLATEPDIISININVMNGVVIDFCAAGGAIGAANTDDEAADLSRYLLEALVDKCDFFKQEDILQRISFSKKL